jgi:hypothetical protein
MNRIRIKICTAALLLLVLGAHAQDWKPAGDRIKTTWAEKVNPVNPWPEYPRPQLVRDQWQNLNGLWDYVILPRGQAAPGQYEGKILVPFAAESSLSGVQKAVGGQNELWYHRTFTIPASWKNKKVLLNFGAVDWKADIWINNIKAGSHTEDIPPFPSISHRLLTRVETRILQSGFDRSDEGYQPQWQTGKRAGRNMVHFCYGIRQTFDRACGSGLYRSLKNST